MLQPSGRSRTCVITEGYLTIPPDRGTILGRALWKNRYVVIGSARGDVNDGKSQTSLSSDCNTFLSIYKNPDDWEPSQQYAVSNITHCQVQMVAHRKQGPVLPTLVLTITPDPATESIRKRRSSRAATLVSGYNGGPTVLWFRTDSDLQKLHEWARCIQAAAQAFHYDRDTRATQVTRLVTPLTPSSPNSPSFQNPFVGRFPRDASEYSYPRPPSAPKSTLYHKASSSSYRTRPLTMSDTNSLRSRTSDLSSLASSAMVGPTTIHSLDSAQYSELASPDMPCCDHFSGFIEGWTSAQGRSVARSPPSRPVRDSMGSNPPLSPGTILDSGSPPNPRETILDRAFQMNYIPGSGTKMPGEDKLSSLARFEALMQQVDAQRRKQSLRPLNVAQQLELKSAWDEDEDDENSDVESDDTEGDVGWEQETGEIHRGFECPEPQRSPEIMRRSQIPRTPSSNVGSQTPITFDAETLAALDGGVEMPRLAQRMHSRTLFGMGLPDLGASCTASGNNTAPASEALSGGLNPSSTFYRTRTIAEGQEQRHSTASSNGGRKPSFGEFTRRLSTSSTKGDLHQQTTQTPTQTRRSSVLRSRVGLSGTKFSSPRNEATESAEKYMSWRNSLGMIGDDGGFL